MILEKANSGLRERLKESCAGLMASRGSIGGRILLDVPTIYPSGASAVVEIERNGDRVRVSDMGNGLLEAEMMAAQDGYRPLARKKAQAFGIGFDNRDNRALFTLWVPEGRLGGAIICVANASTQAAAEAVRVASEARARQKAEAVFERIDRVFGSRATARTAEIRGRRATWNARNVVTLPNARRAIFEPMNNNTGSVSGKFLMFTDIREAGAGIALNAVVEDSQNLNAKAQMVADLANIIDIRSPDEMFKRMGVAG
ncbi:MAG: hypothetical protein GDA53_10810 [Rhodobacteraceae bacterium]|nr:hypothetical protein [Paracoccaceae bacterium]